VLTVLQDFLEGRRFPAFLLAVLTGWPLLLLAMLAIPDGDGEMAAFAAQFKVWCLGYDPATGELQVAYLVMLLVNPLMLIGVVYAVWRVPLADGWEKHRGSVLRWAGAGLALVLGVGFGLTAMVSTGPTPLDGELPFPADALRTRHLPPAIDLVDQNLVGVATDDLLGRVTLLTSVYASCPHTCPRLLSESKRAVEGLAPELRDAVQVWAVTMDPAADRPAQLRALAEMHGLESPTYRLLTGPPPRVNELLDRLGVARERDEATGVIDHSNQFILVGRDGRIAFRLALGPQQERWLSTALEVLIREVPPPSSPGAS